MPLNEIVTFLAGALIGGLISWVITHRYYVKAAEDQKRELGKLSSELQPRKTLIEFEKLLRESAWTPLGGSSKEIWIAGQDNTIQIEVAEDGGDFKESWTTVYPDPNSKSYAVFLKIGGTVVHELVFISMDGGRIFVPITTRRVTPGGGVEYFWDLSDLGIAVCRVIGRYYIYESIEGIAKQSNIVLKRAQ